MLNRDRSLWAATIVAVVISAAAAILVAVAMLTLLQTSPEGDGAAYLEFALRWAWVLLAFIVVSWATGLAFAGLTGRRLGARNINAFTLGACIGPGLLLLAVSLVGDSDAVVLWGALLCLVVFALVLQLMLRRRVGVNSAQSWTREKSVETD